MRSENRIIVCSVFSVHGRVQRCTNVRWRGSAEEAHTEGRPNQMRRVSQVANWPNKSQFDSVGRNED